MGTRWYLATLTLSVFAGCVTDEPREAIAPPVDAALARTRQEGDAERAWVQLALTVDGSAPTALRAAPLPETTALSRPQAQRLLKALPPLPASRNTFRWPPASMPAPRVEHVEAMRTPSAEPSPPPSEIPALAVVRISPEGETTTARGVQIQFNQAMVGLKPPSALEHVPVQLLSDGEAEQGTWRWLDPATLVFEPQQGRMSGARHFTVSVPTTLASARGESLIAPVSTRFSTERPRVVQVLPPDGARSVQARPIIGLRFNQAVRKQAVLDRLTLTAAGQQLPFEPVSEKAIRAQPSYERLLGPFSNQLVFVTAQLPKKEAIHLALAPGPWSAEGPRAADAPFESRFETYGPLSVRSHRCGGQSCRPRQPWSITMSNPLADDQDEPLLRVLSEKKTPVALEQLKVQVRGSGISVWGRTEAKTTYYVQLNPKARDIHGQALGPTDPLRFEVGGARPFLSIPGRKPLLRRPITRRSPDATASPPPSSADRASPGAPLAEPGPAPLSLPIRSAGTRKLGVQIRSVEAKDWGNFLAWTRERSPMPGTSIFEGSIEAAKDPAYISETNLDLEAALEATGHAVLQVSAPVGWEGRMHHERVWVSSSPILLDAWKDTKQLWVSVTDQAGQPRSEVEVLLMPLKQRAVTDGEGLARIPLPASVPEGAMWLETEQDGFLPELQFSGPSSWVLAPSQKPTLNAFAVTDRGLYRPGDTARVRGWTRLQMPDGQLVTPKAGSLEGQLQDPRGKIWKDLSVQVNRAGGFAFTVSVPESANMGTAQAQLKLIASNAAGEQFEKRMWIPIDVQSYRRPRFKVGLSTSPGPQILGKPWTAEVSSNTYDGGPMSLAPVKIVVEAEPANYAPPGWDGYQFGEGRPSIFDGLRFYPGPGRRAVAEISTETNEKGVARVRLQTESLEEPRPYSLHLSASVEGTDRRPVQTTLASLLHPSSRYVGLKPESAVVGANQSLALSMVATSIDGRLQRSTCTVALFEASAFSKDPKAAKAVETRTIETSEQAPTELELSSTRGGAHVVLATTQDAKGRTHTTSSIVYFSGRSPSAQLVDTERVQIIPSKKRYNASEEVVLHVQSALSEARGFVFIEGLQTERQVIKLKEGTAELRLTAKRSMVPKLRVRVWLVGASDGKPRMATGEVELPIYPRDDELNVAVEIEPAAGPGQRHTVWVEVRNRRGQPVSGADFAMAIVDEALLALAPRAEWPNPLEQLYRDLRPPMQAWYSRPQVLLAAEQEAALGGAETLETADDASFAQRSVAKVASAEAGMVAPSSFQAPIRLRSNLSPLAHFEAFGTTDRSGRAQIRYMLPDNLTEYRVRVMASKAATFGRAESHFGVEQGLSLSSGLPRFVTVLDEVELPIVIRNNRFEEQKVSVAMQASGMTVSKDGLSVLVPPRAEAEVRFRGTVQQTGAVTVQVVARGGGGSDALQVTLPSYAPSLTEAFAEYGSVDQQAVARKLEIPPNVEAAAGGLEVSLSPSRLVAAQAALNQLTELKYLCTEARASRLIAGAAFGPVEGMKGPPPSMMAMDAAQLARSQRTDGGWAWYRPSERSSPYLTTHVVHALIKARASLELGDQGVLERGLRYLSRLESHIPSRTSDRVKALLLAHGAWVLAEAKRSKEVPALETILERGGGTEQASLMTLAWLYGASAKQGQATIRDHLYRALSNRIQLTAQNAHLVEPDPIRSSDVLWGSAKADALFLEGLLQYNSKSPLVDKLMGGLFQASSGQGRFRHTEEAAWAMVAAAAYAEARESAQPNMTGGVWVGDRMLGRKQFRARTDPVGLLEVPMQWLVEHPEARKLSLARAKGKGRLYYRIGLSSVSRAKAARQFGFTVTRSFEAVNDSSDVEIKDNLVRVKAGAQVRIKVQVENPGPRHHVAVIDRLAAGFEPLNLRLEGSMPGKPPHRRRWWFWSPWSHQGLRDTGGEAFALYLGPGQHEFSYQARATTPGQYTAGPAKAEEMYNPETFGHSSAMQVEVFEAQKR